jgi:cytochrome c oxidase accessory protein FixG
MAAPSRESLGTIKDDGSRAFVHPHDVRGRFNLVRRGAFAVLIGIYAILPWIPVKGAPAVFLDIGNRRFHLFGQTFVSQDFWLVFFLVTGLGFLLFYLTALFGRIWCGYACPQTVFLDGVYRRVERWLEGDAFRRKRLDAAAWNLEKILRRGGKQVAFILISLIIAHLFIAYFVSISELYRMMGEAPVRNLTVFLWVFVTAGILYFNFAWFREQLCIIVCPYGRLQSALIDDDSIVIGYDEKRGEPRGRVSDPNAGDCIDCFRCVNVCPTGIDIRHGLQMECIGCTACIDACDDVMHRLNRPPGLVRYDSMNGLAGRATRLVRPRTILYTILMLVGAGIFLFSLSQVSVFTASVTRMTGAPYYRHEEGVRNHFNVRVINKAKNPAAFEISAVSNTEGLTWSTSETPFRLEPNEERVTPLFVSIPRSDYEGSFPFEIHIENTGSGHTVTRRVTFLGPDPR